MVDRTVYVADNATAPTSTLPHAARGLVGVLIAEEVHKKLGPLSYVASGGFIYAVPTKYVLPAEGAENG